MHIFNLSIVNGVVPNEIAIFKGGDSEDIGNYRPLSLLPIRSKLYEKLMASRLLNFLEKQSFFTDNNGF